MNTKDYEITFGGSFAIRIGRARPHFNTHSHSPVINQAVFEQLSSSEAIQHFWYPTGTGTVRIKRAHLVDVSQPTNVAIPPLENYLSARKSTDELSTKIYTRVYTYTRTRDEEISKRSLQRDELLEAGSSCGTTGDNDDGEKKERERKKRRRRRKRKEERERERGKNRTWKAVVPMTA